MIESAAIKVERSPLSRLSGLKLENIVFGSHFTDHMLEADYEDGAWSSPVIRPYQPLQIEPSNAAWHYGQSIFEGIKAYPQQDGGIAIFRPYDNFRRFNISAERMQMPAVPEEIFMEGMQLLIDMEKEWMPRFANHALYIRPFMFATDHAIGVRPSATYKFMIILSPSGPYFTVPMKIFVEQQYVRAVQGGVGYAKTSGNYALSMYPTSKAREKGYDQVLWTDAFEHKYVQEIGVMNVFFVVGEEVWTPSLEGGTILEGITRDSVITLLRDRKITVREQKISIEALVTAYRNGILTEVFGAGTAATISMIKQLTCEELDMHFDLSNAPISNSILAELNSIRYGHLTDVHGWLYKV